jgi:leader peptidase (prepilin peptidase)/N-methyltransferase
MVTALFIIIVFIFGLVLGSFFNVCIYRLPRADISIIKPPHSFCPNCTKPIKWFDNIPLVSFILLKGHCRYCREPISLRYPLVELLTAALFAYSFYHLIVKSEQVTALVIATFLVTIYLVSVLVIITFIDFEFRIIPDEITIPGIIIGLIVSTIFPLLQPPLRFIDGNHIPLIGLVSALVGMVAGGGVVYLVGVVGKLVFRKEAMGFGDVKLLMMVGAFLGWESVIYIFFLACFIGALAGITSWIITREHYIAFGPYLSLAAIIVIFFKPYLVIFTTQTYPDFIRSLFL